MKKFLLSLISFSLVLTLSAQSSSNNRNTVVSLQPDASIGKDAMVWSNGPSSNYGSVGYLVSYTWTNSGALGLKRVYLLFDLSSIPSNAIIDSAYLELYFAHNPSEGFSTHSGTTNSYVRRVTMAWNENTINWSNQPSSTSTNQVNVPAHSSPIQDYKINVTSLVTDMMNPANGNYGFMLRMQDELNTYRGLQFASSDFTDASKRPKLTISYRQVSTGLENNKNQLSTIQVQPNPSKGIFQFATDNSLNFNALSITIFDLTGKEVNVKVNQKESSIQLEGLPSGIYLARIQVNEGNISTKKLILQ